MMLLSACQSNPYEFMFAGTYTDSGSKGIYTLQFDKNTGILTLASESDSIINPSFLARKGDYLFAVNETGRSQPGKVSAFTIDRSGKLSFINTQMSGGDDPCHLAVSKDGNWLVVGNYSGGNLSLFPIKSNGAIEPFTQIIQHEGHSVHPQRQQAPHVHETVFSPDGNFLLVPDLGLDKIFIYSFNPNEFVPLKPAEPAFVETPPGSGPRHIAFSKNNNYVYCIHELDGRLSVFSYHNGKMKIIQEIASHPEGKRDKMDGAEILISPNGKFLYASYRGDEDAIAIFSVDPHSGTLKAIGYQSVEGKNPRNITIDPTGKYMLVANQNSQDIVVFEINIKSGLLQKVTQKLALPKPVCLIF